MLRSRKFFKYCKRPKLIRFKFADKVHITNDNWFKLMRVGDVGQVLTCPNTSPELKNNE